MAANMEEMSRESSRLVGDLSSMPQREFRLVDQDVYGLMQAMPFAGSEAPFLRDIIKERMAMLEAELRDPRCHFLDHLVRQRVSHQHRARPDYQSDRIAVEQWMPSMRCWLVNGYFDWSTEVDEIVIALLAGDPRREDAVAALERKRQEAAARRAEIDQQNTDKVAAAVDSLSQRALDTFIQVEEALQSGDNITLRGDDLNQYEAMLQRTKAAAASGDAHAQRVLTQGQSDDSACLLPSTNPLRHQHGSLSRDSQGGA